MAAKQPDKKASPGNEPTFEETLAELESIVSAMEEGKIELQQLISAYERGVELDKRCRAILAEAEMKIQRLQQRQDGKLTPEPFEPADSDDSE